VEGGHDGMGIHMEWKACFKSMIYSEGSYKAFFNVVDGLRSIALGTATVASIKYMRYDLTMVSDTAQGSGGSGLAHRA